MNDQLERTIEIILAVGVSGFSMHALHCGLFSGRQAMFMIIASFALYQSTSMAKIFQIFKGE